MFCPKCGKETDASGQFCQWCGAPIEAAPRLRRQSLRLTLTKAPGSGYMPAWDGGSSHSS